MFSLGIKSSEDAKDHHKEQWSQIKCHIVSLFNFKCIPLKMLTMSSCSYVNTLRKEMLINQMVFFFLD